MTQGMIFIGDLTKQHFCHSTDFDEELTLRLRCVSTWHHSWRSGSKIQSIMKFSCSLPPWWRNMAFHINRFTEVHCLSTVLWNYSQLVSPPLHLLWWLQSRVQSYPGIPPEADGGLEGELKKKRVTPLRICQAVSKGSFHLFFTSQVSPMRIRKEGTQPALLEKARGRARVTPVALPGSVLPCLGSHPTSRRTTQLSPPRKCELHADKIHVFSSTCSQPLAHFPTWPWTNTRITVYPVSHC